MHVCRLHKVLAAERGFAGCTGAAGAPAAEAEAAAMSGALESAFLAMDREILDRARHESGRDGCCALVAVRIGAVPLPDPPFDSPTPLRFCAVKLHGSTRAVSK